MSAHKQFVLNAILRYAFMASLLVWMPASTWAKHETDSVPRLRHELTLGIGFPGLYPLRGATNVSWGEPDPAYVKDAKSSVLIPAFYGQYLSNLNRHIGLGAMLCYAYSGRTSHADYYGDGRNGYSNANYRFNIICHASHFYRNPHRDYGIAYIGTPRRRGTPETTIPSAAGVS